MPPGHAGQKRDETQAQLSDHQREHSYSRPPHRVNAGISRQGADRGPGQHDGHGCGIQHVRPPAQAMMAKHRAQNQLDVENKNREQSQT